MSTPEGSFDPEARYRLLRELYLERRSGVLELGSPHGERRFFFVAGELHLSPGHRQASSLREFMAERDRLVPAEEPGVDPTEDLLERRRALVAALAGEMLDPAVENGRFDDDLKRIPSDLVGPFPTGSLVMQLAVEGQEEEALLRRLGGSEVEVVGQSDERRLERARGLEPGDMFALTRAEKPIAVGELIHQLGGSRLSALERVARLQALDLLGVVHPDPVSGKPRRAVDATVERFLERIAKRLEMEPVDLSPEEHRQRLGRLLAQVGSLTHYELLEVGFHDGVERIHEAYDRLAREVHPQHVGRLGLQGREGAVMLLFERATVAYLTLSDPERRAAYNRHAGIEAGRVQTADERSREKRSVARNNYERALELVENGDYHFALELARLAVRSDPQAEYFALLGRIQSQNPHWLRQAADSYRNAIQLDPDKAEYRVALGKLMEATGDESRARVHYRAALQKDSSSIEARQALQRLGPTSLPVARATSKGLFGRLREWFS